MYVLCRLTGSGTPADPFTVNYPTWSQVAIDYASRRMVIDVHPEDLPPNRRTRPFTEPWATAEVERVLVLDAQFQQAWNEHIRARYPKDFGQWDAGVELR